MSADLHVQQYREDINQLFLEVIPVTDSYIGPREQTAERTVRWLRDNPEIARRLLGFATVGGRR